MVLNMYYFLGAYVPLTNNGNIVIDGVLASCYADFNHNLAHFTMAPMKWFPEIMEWIFGEDAGFSIFVVMARQMGILMLPFGQFI